MFENVACCEHIFARVIERLKGHVANLRRIDAGNSGIGRCWQKEFEEGILQDSLSSSKGMSWEFAV